MALNNRGNAPDFALTTTAGKPAVLSELTKRGSVADIAGAQKACAAPMTERRKYTGQIEWAAKADKIANAVRQRACKKSERPIILRRS